MIIDAKDQLLGRVSSYAAKQVLLGHHVDVINCEQAVVSGTKGNILANYERRIDRKAPNKGPFLYRRPDFFVRRTIRGMLPWKRSRGREAYKLLKCHIGHPAELKEKPFEIKNATHKKLMATHHITVMEICKSIGYRR